MKKSLSLLLALLLTYSFTVSSLAAEPSEAVLQTDMEEIRGEIVYADGKESFMDNSGVMRVIEGEDIGGATANVPYELWSAKELTAGQNVKIVGTWTPNVASIKLELLSDKHAIMTVLQPGETRNLKVVYSDVYRVVVTPIDYNISTGSLTFTW